MKLRFVVHFKLGNQTVAIAHGTRAVDTQDLTVAELTEGVQAIETLLEKLLGLRVHIEQVG